MPKNPSTGFWHQPRLGNCGGAGMLVMCTCRHCQRTVHYLASDLAPIYGEMRRIGEIWGACPRCGRADGWRERERHPTSDDYGTLKIRRPAGFRQIRQWKTEWYEPPAAVTAKD